MAAIDRVLPEWDVREVHKTVLAATPERALGAPAAPDVVRVLLRLRGLRGSGSIEQLLLGMGFEPLAREPDEVVFGAAGKPWLQGGGLGPFGGAEPGTVRIAANFHVAPAAHGRTRLSTETRVRAVDEAGRRRFRRYWRLFGPFSALIRRRWLAAVRRSLRA